MRGILAWVGLSAVLLNGAPGAPAAQPGYAADHVLVQFRPREVPAAVGNLPAEAALRVLAARLGLPAGARLEEPSVSRWLRERKAGGPQSGPGAPVDLRRFLYLHLPPGLTVQECLERLRHHPLLEYAEPDGIGSGGEVIPTDPQFSQQWHHHNTAHPGADIHSTAAWEVTTGATNVIVAVLDTGLDTALAEFSGRLLPGWDYVNSDADPTDDHGHGTAVAGTLCANANNGLAGVGMDWHCRLMPIKVLDNKNNGFYSWWAQGIDFAVAQGAKVINLSAGGSSTSSTLTRAIDEAIAAGVIFVTITHNDGTDTIRYPGSLPQCITVGATDRLDRRTSFSNYGPQIDLVAPGLDIYTVNRSGGFGAWWGTSFSAPLVAGVCSLMASLRPELNQDQAANLLVQGADDQVGDTNDTPGFDIYYGWGRLNAARSLLLASTNTADLSLSLTDNSNPIAPGCTLVYTLALRNGGPAGAQGVWLTNRLPAQASLLSVTTTQGTFEQSDNTLVFALGDLAPNGRAFVTLALSPHALVPLTNQAAVMASQPDPYPADNQVTLATLVANDSTPPALLSAAVEADGCTIALTFSDLLDPVSATNLAHYTLVDAKTNTVAISQAQLGNDAHQVSLRSPPLAAPSPLVLTLEGISDCAGNAMTEETELTLAVDADEDGLPDAWEVEHGLDPANALDAAQDPDQDNFITLDEFQAGTDPWDDLSYFRIEAIQAGPGRVRLQFTAVCSRTYSVLFREQLAGAAWEKLVDLAAALTNRLEIIPDSVPRGAQRAYRLVTPQLPD